jgi:hypothetical protein
MVDAEEVVHRFTMAEIQVRADIRKAIERGCADVTAQLAKCTDEELVVARSEVDFSRHPPLFKTFSTEILRRQEMKHIPTFAHEEPHVGYWRQMFKLRGED